MTWCFYACEEVEQRHNGVRRLFEVRPDLLAADVAILAEPTGGVVEAGCQGTLRVRVELRGRRAHTARPAEGRNAIHRLAPLLAAMSGYDGRRPVIDGCEYAEQLQAVRVEGGVAANVVPDGATVVLNHRFAPDRSPEEAEAGRVPIARPPTQAATAGSWSTAVAGAPPGLSRPRAGRAGRSHRGPGPGQAGMDRHRYLRRPRDPGHQLRTRGSPCWPTPPTSS